MRRVTVKLCPGGDDARRRPIAHAVMGRIPGSVETVDGHVYEAGLWEDRDPQTILTAAITHRPPDGIWALVAATVAESCEAGEPPVTDEVLEVLLARLGAVLPRGERLNLRREDTPGS